jgi:hypothetical protein
LKDVRLSACHAGGRGFEPRPLRQINPKCFLHLGFFLFYRPNLAQASFFESLRAAAMDGSWLARGRDFSASQ